MILTLVREQLRSQSRYAAAACALVGVATTLAAFLLISLATTQRENERLSAAYSRAAEHHAEVTVWTHGPAATDPVAYSPTPIPLDDVEEIVAELEANGSMPSVNYFVSLSVADYGIWPVTAIKDVPASAFVDGAGPRAGQVALNEFLATELGVTVGETVEFARGNGTGTRESLEVSGILREASPSAARNSPYLLISADDGTRLADAVGHPYGETGEGLPTALAIASISWNGEVPEALESWMTSVDFGPPWIASQWEYVAIAALGLVLLTALVAASAAGRSQGAARTRWVGTVRALGATRRDVVGAALAETLLVGAAAGVAGLGVGAAVNVVIIRSQGGTFAGDWPSITTAAAVLPLALALAVALVLGAPPAYWAARATPATALSPVGPADGAPQRRRIGTGQLVAVLVVTAALLLSWAHAASHGREWPLVVVWAIAAILLIALYVMTSRAMTLVTAALGVVLARSRSRALVAAGTGLAHRPTEAASVGSAIAAGGIGAGALVWWWCARRGGIASTPAPMPWADVIGTAASATLLTTGTLGFAAVVLGLAIWIGRARVANDAAVYGAMGLGGRDRQVAAMAQVALASFAGGAIGMVVGTLGAAVTHGALAMLGVWEWPSDAWTVGVVARGAVVWCGALLGIALVSAAISLAAARASDGSDPAALRRKASRAGSPV